MRKWILGGLSLIAVAAIGIGALSYACLGREWDSAWSRRISSILPIPAARVGNRWISYRDYLRQLDATRLFLSGPVARSQNFPEQLTPDIRHKVLLQTMRIEAVEELAEGQGIVLTPLDIEREYRALIARAGTSTTPEEVRVFLRDQFGWDEADFKTHIVRPAMLEAALRESSIQRGETEDVFESMILDRLQKPDVVEYVHIQSEPRDLSM